MKKPYLAICGWLLLSLLLTGCPATETPPAPATPTTEIPVALTATPTSAPTSRPTSTPVPTPTARPTTPVNFVPAETRAAEPISPVGFDGVPLSNRGGMPWWNDAVFYEVFVRSFYDSDGDGVGDLQGLIQKLDYLNDGNPATDDDLGITGIWLMPIHQSPSYHGYDVTDYYSVDDEYGTNADFQQLMTEAHARGIRVIIDLVLNHTSTQHPWFQESRDPNSLRRDWYVWSNERPTGEGWHQDLGNGYYYGYFWDQMPDLNYENPEVTAAMQDVIRFWLEDMGVDGFRLDAIKHLVEENGVLENTPGTLAWFEDFHIFYKDINPNALTVGEVWSNTEQVVAYIGDKVDLAFEFDLADAMLKTAFNARPLMLQVAQEKIIASYPPGQYATFLANHDQSRTRSQMANDGQAKIAATLQLTFGGVPFIYYGEEIGMSGTKPDENIRRPLQWTADGGFTTGTPWHDYYEDYRERHIAGQSTEPDSLFNHYRALIRLRNQHEALRTGAWQPIESDRTQVYSMLRSTANEILIIAVNLSGKPADDYSLSLEVGPFAPGAQPTLLLGEGELYAPEINVAGGFFPYRPLEVIPPYGSVVLQFLHDN